MTDNDIVLWEDLEERQTVDIPLNENGSESLSLRQYVSDDDRWGIYSSVWEGGLALLAYLRQQLSETDTLGMDPILSSKTRAKTMILDLGAGTGIVGLGVAPWQVANQVFLTDLPEALPLLDDNLQRNQKLVGNDSNPVVINAPLEWGKPLPLPIQQAIQGHEHVLLVGADIVYRQNLMGPLLETLQELLDMNGDATKVTCYLSTHTIRSHLPEFFRKCELEYNIDVQVLATVKLPEDKVQGVCHSHIDHWNQGDRETSRTHEDLPKETGVVAITQLCRKA